MVNILKDGTEENTYKKDSDERAKENKIYHYIPDCKNMNIGGIKY